MDAWLENAAGERTEDLAHGEPFGVRLVVEARDELTDPVVGFQVLNVDGAPVFGFGKALAREDEQPVRIGNGQRLRISGDLENPLVPGRYALSCSISRSRAQGDVALKVPQLIEFAVVGKQGPSVAIEEHEVGMVSVQEDVVAVVER